RGSGRQADDPRARHRHRGEAGLRGPVVPLAPVHDGGHLVDDEQQLLQVAHREGRHPVAVRQPGLPPDDQDARPRLRDHAPVACRSRPTLTWPMNDELANDRTYLAWLRTGIALFGLGFVVAKVAFIVQQGTTGVSEKSLYSGVGVL